MSKDTYLQAGSELPGGGRPQAIFLSLQNKQASACFPLDEAFFAVPEAGFVLEVDEVDGED